MKREQNNSLACAQISKFILILKTRQIDRCLDLASEINKFNEYTLMSNYIRSKSFSHSQLKYKDKTISQESSPYFQFKVGNTEPFDSMFANTKLSFSSDPLSSSKSKLVLFKSRLMKGLSRYKDNSRVNNHNNGPIFRNLRINQMLDEDQIQVQSTKQFLDGSVFVREKVKQPNRTVYRFFSHSHKNKENKTQQRSIVLSPETEKSDEKMRQSKSIIVIRRVNKIKEKLVQNKKDKYQEEFYRAKETPIHHSQSFNNRKVMPKVEEGQKKRNSFRNRNAIKDIIRLRETLRKGTFEQLRQFGQAQPFQVLVKGNSSFSQHFCFKRNTEVIKTQVEKHQVIKRPAPPAPKKSVKAVKKMDKVKKDQEIGPW